MIIYLEDLKLWTRLCSNIPMRTPKRKSLMKTEFIKNRKPNETIKVNINTGSMFVVNHFDVEDEAHLQCLLKFIETEANENVDNHEKSGALKVFLPEKIECCGMSLQLSREGIGGKYFTSLGTIPSKVYQSTCRKCSTTFFPGYSESIAEEVVLRSYISLNSDTQTFALTTMSLFSLDFLRRKIKEDALDATILLDSWIVYNIVKRLPGINLEVARRSNRNLDTERLAKKAFPELEQLINLFWKPHRCREVGCFNRAAVVDANEKNHRMKCAFNSRCVTNVNDAPNFFSGCINNPIRSETKTSDDVSQKSKFCKEHSSNLSPQSNSTAEQADIRPMTRAFVKNCKENDQDSIDLAEDGITDPSGCRGLDKITRFFDRTAGMIWLVRPCLIRLGRWEMFSAESMSQWAICFVDCFGESPNEEDLQYIIGDRVCGFQPYLRNLGRRGNDVFKKYSELNFILDTFHGDKHIKKECLNEPEYGIFNSRLPKWKDVRGTNYEAAEQTFRFINRSKATTNYMTYAKRLCFFVIMDDEYNFYLEESMSTPNKNGKFKIGKQFFDENPIITKASKDQPWRQI